MRLRPLTPIFDKEPQRGAIAAGNAPTLTLVEEFFVPATASGGVAASGTYGVVKITIDGIGYYYTGAYTDPEVTGGSIGIAHGSGSQWSINGGPWTHIEPDGGPYSVAQPGNLYTWTIDMASQPFAIRFGDSLWTDNSGGWTVRIYEAG